MEAVKPILELSALLLAVMNGLILVLMFMKDRSKLVLKVIHPDTYQWFFRLKDTTEDGTIYAHIGFLVYIGIANRGLRDAALGSWRLLIKKRRKKMFPWLWNWIELTSLSIPEPRAELSGTGHEKRYAVLGGKGETFEGSTFISSGASISGFAYYVLSTTPEDIKDSELGPETKIHGKMAVTDAFGKKCSCIIPFSYITLAEVDKFVPGISSIGFGSNEN